MKHIYYIDLENVQAKGLKGVGAITKEDTVYIFYSKHAMPRIPFKTAQEIALSQGTFIFKEVVKLGKNAMDKEIIKETRKHMKKHKDYIYHIVSNDKGYKKEFESKVLYQSEVKKY